MLAVAVANVSQKPAVDLDKWSHFDDINIERRRGWMWTGGRERKPRGPGGHQAILKMRK